MKKIVIILVLLIFNFRSFSQDYSEVKRLSYGFNFGVNHSNILYNNMLPANASVKNDVGFRLGILADYKISDLLFIRPKTELSFNQGKVTFLNTDESEHDYDVMPVSLDLILHFTFIKSDRKLKPYFFAGPSFKIPLNKTESSNEYGTNSDYAIDFGIGLEKPFTNFRLSPELRYSYGLGNVNTNPLIRSLNFHNISLVINFLG